MKRKSVVVIGVDRHGVGCGNSFPETSPRSRAVITGLRLAHC
jgi:hypothetical protein